MDRISAMSVGRYTMSSTILHAEGVSTTDNVNNYNRNYLREAKRSEGKRRRESMQ